MPFYLREYLTYFYYSFFRSQGTPGKLSPKRIFILLFLFFCYPIWNIYIRLGLFLDQMFFPAYQQAMAQDPVFIVGNYRSGSTFLHRLLLRDEKNTCLKAWEIYFAPAISHRKFLRLIKSISSRIGSPLERFVKGFDKSLNNIYSMHQTGLMTYEQDSQLFYHIWSSYNLFAIFPFLDLAEKYIYYDQAVPKAKRDRDFMFYRHVLSRHFCLHPGRQYISKNPDFTPAVETLREVFPQAKFINLVRPPESMIPSLVNLWSRNWHTYGSPEEQYPMVDVLKTQAKHWYSYPQERLSDLPPDRYQVVDFKEFIYDPHKVVTRIYKEFGYQLTPAYEKVLEEETIKARQYTNNRYSLVDMGLDKVKLKVEFTSALDGYTTELPIQKPEKELF
jgi:hypothetical protein